MKKILVVLVIVATVFSCCACGNSGSSSKDNKTISIVDSGWSVSKFGYVYYSVKIKNNSEKMTVQYPQYCVTAYDEAGNVIEAYEHTLMEIKPGATVAYATQAFECSAPSKVEVTAIEPKDDNWIKDEKSQWPDLKELSIATNASATKDALGVASYSGEIVNENDTTINSVAVTIIFKDANGKLLGGETTFVDDVKGNGKTPFTIKTLYSGIETDSYEIFAQPWM